MKQLGKIIIIVLLLSAFGEAAAQTAQVVSGTVTENEGGRLIPVPGVNVTVVNAQNRTLSGTVADGNGQYNLRIPAGERNLTLVYSFIGKKTKTVPYTNQSSQNMTLDDDDTQIETVEVIGRQMNDMGIGPRQMVSATEKIDLAAIAETSPLTSIEDMLQGQMAGVDVITAGDPGARSSIVIRGIGTLNSSVDPLIVIDGVPYSTDTDDFDFQTANEEDLGALLNISPSDIATVEVLKDASATAIWGTEGANGVLLITTKRGTKGKAQFSFSSKLTTKFEPSSIPMLNGAQYKALMQDAIWNSAQYVGVSYASSYLRLLYDTPEINYQPEWKYFPEYSQDTDWVKLVRQSAKTWDHSFSISGGGDKASYYISMTLTDEDGTTIGTSLNRITTTTNIDYKFSDRMRFNVKFTYSDATKEGNYATNVRSEAFGKMPNKSPYAIDRNTGKATEDYFTYHSPTWEGTFNYNEKKNEGANFNPVAMVHEASNTTAARERQIKIGMDYRILPGLDYKVWATIVSKSNKNQMYLPQVVTGLAIMSRYANRSTDNYSESLSIQTQNQLRYIKTWNEKHSLVANAILKTSQSTSSQYSSVTSGMSSSDLSDPILGTTVFSMGSGESEKRTMSMLASLNYSFKDRYVVESVVNYTGSSALGRNKRWAVFPTVGFSWNAEQEEFLKEKEWLSQAKFRVGVGQSGRSPSGNSVYKGTFSGSDTYMGMSTIYPSSMQLDNLKWETSTEYNIGLDVAFFRNQNVSFTFDYYHRYSSDLLQKDVTIPSSTGFSKIDHFNSGKMENKGFEFRANVLFYRTKEWTVTGSFNMARNRNMITELPVNMSIESGVAEGDADMRNGQYAFRIQEGNPVGSFYGYRSQGVYRDKESTYARDARGNIMVDMNDNTITMRNGTFTAFPGDAKYEDINHDGVINKYDIVYLGNSQPTVTGGVTFRVAYKNISLAATLHGRFGQSIVNSARMENESMYGRKNQSKAVLRRWTHEEDDTDIPRGLYGLGLNYLGSSRFVEDASFLRLKTLTVNYNFPKDFCNRMGINRLSVFATGYNLITWTKYNGQDPEVTTPSKPNKVAQDEATTPRAQQFAFGLNLTF